MKFRRLFIGIGKTNEKHSVCLASWSYRSGYWRWAIWRRRHRSWKVDFGGGYGFGTKKRFFTPGGRGRSGYVTVNTAIPLVGYFTFSTQPRMDSMKW